jgi:hypothetical protein
MGKTCLCLIAICAPALISSAVGAEELCGRSFAAFDKFYATIDEEKTHQMRGGGPDDAMFIDTQGTLWLFTKESHPAFPAVACASHVQKGKRLESERHFWCRGPGGGVCDAFLKRFPADGLAGSFEWK